MDLVSLTIATDKIEFRCNAELTEAERCAAVEKMCRLTREYTEIIRVYIDVERDADASRPSSFVAKGQIELGGPAILASIADRDPLKSVEILLEYFARQLHRRNHRRDRVSLRAPKTPPPPAR
jgi:putative sigma-54 modulation protein